MECNNNNSGKNLLAKAKQLLSDNQTESGIKLLIRFTNEYPDSIYLGIAYALLSSANLDLQNTKESISFAQYAIEENPDNEFCSMALYLSYSEANMDSKAIRELKRFLSKNKANLYLTTLTELIEGLEKGFGLAFEEDILLMARENNLISLN